MGSVPFLNYKVEDRSYLSFIKREIHNLLISHGFSVSRAGEADIIISELLSNLIKHADSGELLYRITGDEEAGDLTFELYCLDNGPGIKDLSLMMKDGNSSSNTLGHGLGAIRRLSSHFDIFSMQNWGTVSYSKLMSKPVTAYVRNIKGEFTYKTLQVSMPGQKVCGDGYSVKKLDGNTFIFAGDGLGHGELANEAVSKAIEAFLRCEETEPADIIRFIHREVKKTRGLVGTVVSLNAAQGKWKICGVGNIATQLCNGMLVRNYMSHNGIIGHNIPGGLSNYTVDDEKFHYIMMCSDGIKTRWNTQNYPAFFRYSQAIMAGILFKDFGRRTDDMSILIGKINP